MRSLYERYVEIVKANTPHTRGHRTRRENKVLAARDATAEAEAKRREYLSRFGRKDEMSLRQAVYYNSLLQGAREARSRERIAEENLASLLERQRLESELDLKYHEIEWQVDERAREEAGRGIRAFNAAETRATNQIESLNDDIDELNRKISRERSRIRRGKGHVGNVTRWKNQKEKIFEERKERIESRRQTRGRRREFAAAAGIEIDEPEEELTPGQKAAITRRQREEQMTPEERQALFLRRSEAGRRAALTRRGQSTHQRKTVRNTGVKSIAASIAGGLVDNENQASNIVDSVIGDGVLEEIKVDTGTLEDRVYSSSKKLARELLPEGSPDHIVEFVANRAADVASEATRRMANNDAQNLKNRLKHSFDNQGINADEVKGLVDDYIGLNNRQIDQLERFRYEQELQIRQAKPVNRMFLTKKDKKVVDERVSAYAARLRAQRSLVISEVEQVRMVNTLQQAHWDEMVRTGQMPESQLKKWVTRHDEMVCFECSEMDGKKIPVTESWDTKTRHEVVDFPPMHPRCRCLIELTD